jgi:hypothetical protein
MLIRARAMSGAGRGVTAAGVADRTAQVQAAVRGSASAAAVADHTSARPYSVKAESTREQAVAAYGPEKGRTRLTSGRPPNASMNCKSIARLFGVLYRRYSSKMDVSDHDWIRRRQPTTQPVRC